VRRLPISLVEGSVGPPSGLTHTYGRPIVGVIRSYRSGTISFGDPSNPRSGITISVVAVPDGCNIDSAGNHLDTAIGPAKVAAAILSVDR